MKKLLFLLLLTLNGCTLFTIETFDVTFFIENGLDENVVVILDLDAGRDPEQRVLTPGQRLESTTQETDSSPFDDPDNLFPLSLFFVDSISIIFNNDRILISTFFFDGEPGEGEFSEPIVHNLLRIGNYESIGNDQYLYTITQADFDAATPCDGPCE